MTDSETPCYDFVKRQAREGRRARIGIVGGLICQLRPLAMIAVLGASAIGLGACGQTTYEQLAATHEAQLFFPGSEIVSKYGEGESSGIDTGRTAAYAVVTLTSDKPMADIYAWYKSRLLDEGWQLRAIETAAGNSYGFTKGDRQIFYVASLGSTESKTRYSIKYGVLPAACATNPPPLSLVNC